MRARGADEGARATAADRAACPAQSSGASRSTRARKVNMKSSVGSGFSRTFFLVAALVLYAAIASAADITWTVDGVERAAIIYVPKAPPPRKLPLVLSLPLHGPRRRRTELSFARSAPGVAGRHRRLLSRIAEPRRISGVAGGTRRLW